MALSIRWVSRAFLTESRLLWNVREEIRIVDGVKMNALTLEVVGLLGWFDFTRCDNVVNVHEKAREAAAEVTHVATRHRARQLAVMMFLSQTKG